MAAVFLTVAVVVASIWSLTRESSSTDSAVKAATLEPAIIAEPPVEDPDTDSAGLRQATQATLLQELSLADELTTTDFAFASLFELWGLEFTRGSKSACEQAVAAGLACLNQRGSWNGLRQLNRPAILTVIDNEGNSHELVLTAIHGDSANLSIGGVAVTHPVSEIMPLWFGEFTLLWRPPAGRSVSLSPGSRGAEVLWLRQSLADIDEDYRSNDIDSDEYDANLQNTVREFQRDSRLDVDGLAGQQTLIIINSLLGSDGSPRLTSPKLAEG